MGWTWSIRLIEYKAELGLPIGVLTDKNEVNEELLELEHVVRAAASDDTLAEVYTLNSMEDDEDQGESFECPSLRSLFGEDVEAHIYFDDDPSESAKHAQCGGRILGRDSMQNMLHFNAFVSGTERMHSYHLNSWPHIHPCARAGDLRVAGADDPVGLRGRACHRQFLQAADPAADAPCGLEWRVHVAICPKAAEPAWAAAGGWLQGLGHRAPAA